jgi:hypothetical protein
MVLDPDLLPFNGPNNPWAIFNAFTGEQLCNPNQLRKLFGATHICSYLCATSAYVDTDNNRCWLGVGGAPPAPGASLCTA